MISRRQESEPRRGSRVAVAVLLGVASIAPAAACSRRALAPDDGGGAGQVGIDAAGHDVMIHVVSDARAADVEPDALADVAGDAPIDASIDAPDNGLHCGDGVTCYGTDVCVIVNLCGGPVNCQDTIDAGQCPPGSTLSPNCPTGRPGCVPPCPPPAAFCVPQPATCNGQLGCACLPSAFCPLGICWRTEGRVAFCANQ